MFYKKATLKNFAIFTEKHLCWNLLFNKNIGLQVCNFITKGLQRRCFLANIENFLRTPILKSISERLPLRVFLERFPTWANTRGSEEDIFSKTKQEKRSKTQLDEKNLRFYDVLYHFVFLYFSTARQAAFALHKRT